MEIDKKYMSLLDELSSYAFTSLEELKSLDNDSTIRSVRVLGRFQETKQGIALKLDNTHVLCNFKQMRHKFLMNTSDCFECLGQYVEFLFNGIE